MDFGLNKYQKLHIWSGQIDSIPKGYEKTVQFQQIEENGTAVWTVARLWYPSPENSPPERKNWYPQNNMEKTVLILTNYAILVLTYSFGIVSSTKMLTKKMGEVCYLLLDWLRDMMNWCDYRQETHSIKSIFQGFQTIGVNGVATGQWEDWLAERAISLSSSNTSWVVWQ